MDVLISGYENTDMALHYGAMLRKCIRRQSVARYVLESVHMKKFFDYIQLPNFDIAADAAATFKVAAGELELINWSPEEFESKLQCCSFLGITGNDRGCIGSSYRP